MSAQGHDRCCVAILSPAYPVLSETFVQRDVEGLRGSGCEVVTVGLRDGDGSGAADFVVYRGAVRSTLAEFIRSPLRAFKSLALVVGDALVPGEPTCMSARLKIIAQGLAGIGLAGRLRVRGVQHIHCHFAHSPTTVGMYAANQLGVRFSFVGHANDIFQRRQILRLKLGRAAFVACISEWHRRLYEEIAGGLGAKAHVIRCGVSVAEWTGVERPRKPGAEFQLISVARLVEKKGLDTVIDALARPEAERAHWTVVGDGPLRQRLEERATRAGISDRVHWRGALPNEEVIELVASSDLFVLPCRESRSGDRDGIPVALMEAMAAWVPVVAGDLPAIRELVEDGVTGWLLAPGDNERLGALIGQFSEGREQTRAIAAAARSRVEQEFSSDINHERLRTCLHEAIHGS